MKRFSVLLLPAICLLLLANCSKTKTPPSSNTSGVSVLPWEFDITIDNYRSHFKSGSKTSVGNYAGYSIVGSALPGKAAILIGGGNTLDPEFVAGDVMTGNFGYVDYGVGLRKPVSLIYFNLKKYDLVFQNNVYLNDTNFVINVKDLGKPYELDKASGMWINGSTGLVEIPTQKLKCQRQRGTLAPKDTVCTISGKIIFSSAKP